MPDIEAGCKNIAQNGCHSSTGNVPSKSEDHDRVQHDIDQVADQHAHHGDVCLALGADDIAEAVADDQKGNGGGDDAQILRGIAHRVVACADSPAHRFGEEEDNNHRDDTDTETGPETEGGGGLRLFCFAFPERS